MVNSLLYLAQYKSLEKDGKQLTQKSKQHINWTLQSDTIKQLQISIILTNPLRNWLK